MQQPLPGGVAERFSLDDFIVRVAEREGVSVLEATTNAHVVASLSGEVLSMGQLEHLIAQLPTDIAHLFITQNAGDVE